MNREELKQGNFYVWGCIIVKVVKIWTDRVAYLKPTQVCTCIIEYNPSDRGINPPSHIYKIGDKVVIDEWKTELQVLKYSNYDYDLVAGVFK